jgi:hypothetical protein
LEAEGVAVSVNHEASADVQPNVSAVAEVESPAAPVESIQESSGTSRAQASETDTNIESTPVEPVVAAEPVSDRPAPVQAQASQPMPVDEEKPEATAKAASDEAADMEKASEEGAQPEAMVATDSPEEEIRKEPNA